MNTIRKHRTPNRVKVAAATHAAGSRPPNGGLSKAGLAFLATISAVSVIMAVSPVGNGPGTPATVFGTAAARGMPKQICISIRTDGHAGTGMADDPFDATNFDTLMADTSKIPTSACVIYFAPGTYTTDPIARTWVFHSGWTWTSSNTASKALIQAVGSGSAHTGDYAVIGDAGNTNQGLTSATVSNLSIDANWTEMQTHMATANSEKNTKVFGVFLTGSNIVVEGCLVQNFYGSLANGREVSGILVGGPQAKNNIVRFCTISNGQGTYTNGISAWSLSAVDSNDQDGFDAYGNMILGTDSSLDYPAITNGGITLAGLVNGRFYANTITDAFAGLYNDTGTSKKIVFGPGNYLIRCGNGVILAQAGRTVTDGVTTSGSATVTSATAAFTSADLHKSISGTGIPAASYIGIVNSGTSIGLSSSVTANTAVNATASGTGITVNISTIKREITVFGNNFNFKNRRRDNGGHSAIAIFNGTTTGIQIANNVWTWDSSGGSSGPYQPFFCNGMVNAVITDNTSAAATDVCYKDGTNVQLLHNVKPDGTVIDATAGNTLGDNVATSVAAKVSHGDGATITFTGGVAADRQKTLRDAADTVLELGGNYTPTGTYTSMLLTSPKVTLAASALADDTYAGTTVTAYNNSGGVTQWQAVYLNGSSQWVVADANGSGTYPARGIAVATVSTGGATIVLEDGVFRDDGGTAWTPGGTVYLSTTAGALTQTAPTTTGDKVQVIGYALAAHVVRVKIGTDYGTAP